MACKVHLLQFVIQVVVVKKVAFFSFFYISLICYSENMHNTPLYRPLASSSEANYTLPEKGIIFFDGFLAKPSFKSNRITPIDLSELPLWERDINDWNKGLENKITRIIRLLEKKEKLSSNSVQALIIMREKYLKAKNLFNNEFIGKSIVTTLERMGVEEIEELFLTYCEAFSNIIEESRLKEKLAYQEVLEKNPKHINFEKLTTIHNNETLSELVKLRDFLLNTGKFELFAEYFIRGYNPQFRKPWNKILTF